MGLSPHDRYLSTRHFASLDGLRCLAILPVIWHHATPRVLPGLLGKGPVGVDLFFCISGFLITTLLLRESRTRGQVALGAFYVRRALRIFPLYFLTLVGYTIFAALLAPADPARAHFFDLLPFYATFTANWFGNFDVAFPVLFAFAWSLCVEEQFYALWPGTLLALGRSKAALALLALIGLDALAEHGLLNGVLPQGTLALRIVTSFCTPIGLGAALALLLDDERAHSRICEWLGFRWMPMIALAGALALLAIPNGPPFAYQLALTTLVGACVSNEQHALCGLLQARPVSYLGRISYGLYLLHPCCIGLVRKFFPHYVGSALVVFLLSLPLAVALAAMSHRYFESYFLRFRRSFLVPTAAPELAPKATP
ncbi:MAG TPA: acyltransferase [Polyangiaceae bacterium]|nr:acyltransferase [Polyangiaceae bacterium]